MEITTTNDGSLSKKYIVYTILLAAAFSWPWLWSTTAGSAGEGDIVDLISLGTIPAIFISAIIVYREAKTFPATYKWAFAMALATALLLVWIIPAVGIFSHSGDPADLPFYGVIAVGIIGSLISRFRALGMAYTLTSMAIAQMLVSLYGLISGLGPVLILNGFFAALWFGSAFLFRKATQRGPDPETL